MIRLLRRGHHRPPTYRWWLVARHRSTGVDAFVRGPFRTERRAADYPNSGGGYVDSFAYRHDTFDLRVERTRRGERPTLRADSPQPKPTGALDLYLSTGRHPTGQAAEILHKAARESDRRPR